MEDDLFYRSVSSPTEKLALEDLFLLMKIPTDSGICFFNLYREIFKEQMASFLAM